MFSFVNFSKSALAQQMLLHILINNLISVEFLALIIIVEQFIVLEESQVLVSQLNPSDGIDFGM